LYLCHQVSDIKSVRHSANRFDVRNLMAEIKDKYPAKTIWLYTGDSWEEIYQYPMMEYVDVVVDGEFHIEELDPKLLWKGSKNQRVINVKKTLAQENPEIPVLHCGDYQESDVLRQTEADLQSNKLCGI
ncbi:MAG: 4Fe-4S cluster-binding domain-containing protein, partial [Lachnospiraceae bacterium]|nr:4Fe-4S cluster-binding domain-containing protein [Lachnospiraceae bacterium]